MVLVIIAHVYIIGGNLQCQRSRANVGDKIKQARKKKRNGETETKQEKEGSMKKYGKGGSYYLSHKLQMRKKKKINGSKCQTRKRGGIKN